MPPLLAGYLGNQSRVLGLIKQSPSDFIVQERQHSHLCTIGPEPDLTEAQLDATTGDLVGGTLVLYKMTSPDGTYRAAKQLGIKEGQIDFAGFKDRSAITAQRVTISGVTVDQVVRLVVRKFSRRRVSSSRTFAGRRRRYSLVT